MNLMPITSAILSSFLLGTGFILTMLVVINNDNDTVTFNRREISRILHQCNVTMI